MMCTTVLHGGVCHRTSTPHKSGNKMKEKKIRFNHYLRLEPTIIIMRNNYCDARWYSFESLLVTHSLTGFANYAKKLLN